MIRSFSPQQPGRLVFQASPATALDFYSSTSTITVAGAW